MVNCGKSDITSAQEQPNGYVVVHDPTATTSQVETPWMIVSPDGERGFANYFTTNAISVVSGDGTNYYAHTENWGGTSDTHDRTKVIHFTVHDGIPSMHGEVIDTTNSGETNNVERMKGRTLIAEKGGYLYFYPVRRIGTSLIYNPQTGDARTDMSGKPTKSPTEQTCLAVYQDGSNFYFWKRYFVQFYNDDFPLELKGLHRVEGANVLSQRLCEDEYDFYPTVMTGLPTQKGGKFYIDMHDKKVLELDVDREKFLTEGEISTNVVATLPGKISGLSNNGEEVFATSADTNAFYNVTLGQYNVVKDENGNPKPMVPQTNEGLLRVIDNRKKGGKFLYVTAKGIHSIND